MSFNKLQGRTIKNTMCKHGQRIDLRTVPPDKKNMGRPGFSLKKYLDNMNIFYYAFKVITIRLTLHSRGYSTIKTLIQRVFNLFYFFFRTTRLTRTFLITFSSKSGPCTYRDN